MPETVEQLIAKAKQTAVQEIVLWLRQCLEISTIGPLEGLPPRFGEVCAILADDIANGNYLKQTSAYTDLLAFRHPFGGATHADP